jgi:hypothetical protein
MTSFRNIVLLLVVGGVSYVASEFDCFDLAPYAINPEYLSILTGGGDVPNDAAVYFEFPSTFVEGEVIYCLKDILIPSTVGGNLCNDSEECWLAVGNRAAATRGVSAAQYNCLCSGSDMNPSTFSAGSLSDTCGLQNEDLWELTCRDAKSGGNYISEEGLSVASNYSSAYISICPESSQNCGVCQDGGGLHPSFVVGVQWVSNLRNQCVSNPFASYVEYCSTGLAVSSIVGIAVGGVLLIAAVGGLFYYRRMVRRRRDTIFGKRTDVQEGRCLDVEGQKSDVPPMEEISITTDGSPVE